MTVPIRKAVVLGAGVMGAGIAAHLANAGLEVVLLDIVPEGASPDDRMARNRLAETARQRLLKQNPSPLFVPDVLERISSGNMEDDLSAVSDADWVIEAVVERLDIKQQLFERIERVWKPGTIVSSNTSGISIRRMFAGRDERFQQHGLGTHFFNPPRYMKLVELIPTEQTSPEIVARIKLCLESTVGKNVVFAKDTPNFIANRIGTFGLLVSLEEMLRQGLSVSSVDALTGPVIGRPKSATFRTLDLVGLDTFAHVVRNVSEHVEDPAERAVFQLPELINRLVADGRLGEKTGHGFYETKSTPTGKEIRELEPATLQYVPQSKPRFASVGEAGNRKTLAEKLRVMTTGTDPGSRFVWTVLKRTMLYAAQKMTEIADDIGSVDDAMKWGFNWELGPFETWDLLGFTEMAERIKADGDSLPDWVEAMLTKGKTSFYEQLQGKVFYVRSDGNYEPKEETGHRMSLRLLKEAGKTIRKNAGASLIDIGDNVACLELHSPNNAVGPDILQMVGIALEEVRRNYRGLVIASIGTHFSVGANLMLLLMEAQDENWPEINRMISQFQDASMAIKYFEKPIVSAPYGMTLGGGVELSTPASRVQAAAELYMGLVEAGVGLIPAGSGTKELLWRFTVPVDFDGKVDLQPFVNRAFETIGLAKVSTSAEEAKRVGYLRSTDGISMNRDFQLYDAKMNVLGLSQMGYTPPKRTKARVVGTPGLAVMQMGIYQMQCAGKISEHDAKIGRKLAQILSGGQVQAGTFLTEEQMLELEREAFLSLCGEPKSQARMQHMLTAGKPLRN